MENIDKEIITRCQSGDKEAFRIVVKHYQRMIFSLSLKMLEDEEDAKDVTQETFRLNRFCPWIATHQTASQNIIVQRYNIQNNV